MAPPTLPFSPPYTVGTTSSSSRRRGNKSSSTDYEEEIPGLAYSVTQEGLDSEPFRVGGPELDMLPFQQSVPSRNDLLQFNEQLRPKLQSILSKYSVDSEIRFVQFQSEAYPNARANYYAYVELPYYEGCRAVWEKLADSLYVLLKELGYDDSLKVLVAAEKALRPPESWPIEAGSSLGSAWDEMAQKILRFLSEYGMTTWYCLVFVQRAHPTVRSNELIPTVCLGIRWDSDQDWISIGPHTKALFQTQNLWIQRRVRLEIKRGYLEGGITTSFQNSSVLNTEAIVHHGDNFFSPVAYAGASICPGQQEDCPASFGCAITLGDTGDVYGLTNCHVVLRSSDSSVSYAHPPAQRNMHADIIPLLPTDAGHGQIPGHTTIMMPSQRDGDDLSEYLEKRTKDVQDELDEIAKGEIPTAMLAQGFGPRQLVKTYQFATNRKQEYQQKKSRVDQFMAPANNSQRVLGHVDAISGFRMDAQSGYVLDWALIKLLKHKAPAENTIPSKIFGSDLPTDAMLTFEDAIPGEDVYKIGRKTGITTGLVNALHGYLQGDYRRVWPMTAANTLSQAAAVKVDVLVSAGSQAFCEEGDSGSAVFNKKGRMVGLLVGGSKVYDVSYFTPQKELIKDIKAITGAKVVRLVGAD